MPVAHYERCSARQRPENRGENDKKERGVIGGVDDVVEVVVVFLIRKRRSRLQEV